MGLIQDLKIIKRNRQKHETESLLGFSELDIELMKQQIIELKKEIEKLKNEKPQTITLTKAEKERIEQQYLNSLTPEKMVEIFAGDVEEFYPNGKETNN